MTERGPGVAELGIADDASAWTAAGFRVDEATEVRVGTTRLRLLGDEEPRGMRSWTLRADVGGDVDGLPTSVERFAPPTPAPPHPNGAVSIDHVVVGSPNRERTIAALRDALGLEPRHQTDHELYGRPMVQTFYVLDDLVLEVISRPDEAGDGPSVFWGLAFTVSDLGETAAFLGDALGEPRVAVQPGRRIATLRGEELGISVPVAFLTPRP